ncbi:Sec-independent protein translocase protein TatB [Bradyrhizobium septentrionale]|uniref:Sec-independent protein translocase protein TatB n=1 Tax=Bradyrhizobium septentrionale TaxID=1404411 RepID=A0A973W1E0_9BRAD|nr:Sec-independent protein translocase protein TatB [Bradyrhizobium septentrionale]UGY14504.1 Sec-independent protein translocase protein TatB [Bradyrhizobium septentrionale]
MFDIGWSELVVIAVVALIAIGPKELPGVLRMVGQWMGKARKMASEFQGQFQEAMREAEMADIKKSFDEVKEAATGITSGNIMTSLQKDVSDALQIDKPVDAQVASAIDAPVTSSDAPVTSSDAQVTSSDAQVTSSDALVTPTTPAAPTPETFVEAETHAATTEPLAITSEVKPEPAPSQDVTPAEPEVLKDARAS